MTRQTIAKRLEIEGIVQGVGFRPFVHQLARHHGIKGEIANTSSGVSVRAEGCCADMDAFCADILDKKPPLAHITEISAHPETTRGFKDFSIAKSRECPDASTLISPDVCVCENCLRELFDPQDRRYAYPFINCTNCGPRYTIISGLPYDRPNTSMKHFRMCQRCQAEYDDPANRRFHAQPNACEECGPRVALHDNAGTRLESDNPIGHAAFLLKQGHIVAVKGLGGFHLAADAKNRDAVLRLRKRKHREEKPFALMSFDLERIREYALVRPEEKKLLLSFQRPIVLLEKKTPNPLSDAVSPGNPCFGVMLPYTPLHYLLLDTPLRPPRGGIFETCSIRIPPLRGARGGVNFLALVMTSGNMSEEPIAIRNEEAFERLSGIADYFLIHNRDIYLRSDDSIVRTQQPAPKTQNPATRTQRHPASKIQDPRSKIQDPRSKIQDPRSKIQDPRSNIQFFRRSRGYVPMPVFLKQKVPQILACGAELKNTLCLTKENRAFLSQHIGDMENLAAYAFFEETAAHMKRILGITPEVVAHDLHPDYLTTRYAKENSDGAIRIPVQHHHAHIVSAMAENMLDGPVIGLAFDGTGYGSDGRIWGGEILISEAHRFERAAHLSYVPMPGSAVAVKEPWRMGLSYLRHGFGESFPDFDLPLLRTTEEKKTKIILEMMEKGVNSPLTSSLGRLFDGIAGIMGIRNRVSFEGQAAMELEMLADKHGDTTYDCEWKTGETYEILLPPVIRGVVADMEKGVPLPEISGKFHRTLIRLFSEMCGIIGKERGLRQAVLSGGVFQNAILLEGLTNSLERKGFQVFTNRQVLPNDGGISLGQALVAASLKK